jgi:YfiR/HmsC-like
MRIGPGIRLASLANLSLRSQERGPAAGHVRAHIRVARSLQSARLSGRVSRLLLIATLALPFSAAPSQPSHPVTQSDLEAVYLYNFGKFVSWPQEDSSSSIPFTICTLGNEDFDGALDNLTSNDSMQGRKIVIRRLTSIAGADGCHILFLGESEEVRLARDLSAIHLKPILTVSTLPSFLDRGGMIQFISQNKRVRFAVNLSSTAQAHLAVSSELLKVAVAVQGKPAEVSK